MLSEYTNQNQLAMVAYYHTVVAGAPSGLPVPILAAPSHATTNLATSLTLTWNPSSGVTTYHVQVAADSLFGHMEVDQTGVSGTSLSITSLTNSTEYYWRVRATNGADVGEFSTPWKFTTQSAVNPPSAPVLVSPQNGAASVAVNARLIWNVSTGAASYRLRVSTSSSFSSTVLDQTGLTDTSLAMTGLRTSTTYYWQVYAANSAGNSPYSVTNRFTTSRRLAAPALDSTTTTGPSVANTIPREFSLRQNYPNPFNPNTRIELALPQACQVTLEIFNVLGQKVRTLVNGQMSAGNHSVEWNSTDDRGRQVSSGIYLYRLTAGDYLETRKMVLLK